MNGTGTNSFRRLRPGRSHVRASSRTHSGCGSSTVVSGRCRIVAPLPAEAAVGQFEFMVALPGDVDPEKVEASLHDGVLTVRLGKAAASRPRQIEVKAT